APAGTAQPDAAADTVRAAPGASVPLLHVRHGEGVVRHAAVVAHVADLEERVGAVLHVGDGGLLRGGEVLDALVAAHRHALEELAVEVVHLDLPEQEVAAAEPQAVARVRELVVLRRERDYLAGLSVE